jgi:hypothetical protein
VLIFILNNRISDEEIRAFAKNANTSSLAGIEPVALTAIAITN